MSVADQIRSGTTQGKKNGFTTKSEKKRQLDLKIVKIRIHWKGKFTVTCETCCDDLQSDKAIRGQVPSRDDPQPSLCTTTSSCHNPVALVLAMQSMPQLLRQSLRSSLQLTSTSSPVRAHFRSAFSVTSLTPRSFSACVQCQFRRQLGLHSVFNDRQKFSADTERLIREKEKELADLELASRDPVPIPGLEVGSSLDSVPPVTETDQTTVQPQTKENEKDQSAPQEEDASAAGMRSGGLPSYLESRRSKWSKQFSTVMDNVQSNLFVAGQRLNDFTGYSSIEALKNDIQFHGMSHSTTAQT